MTELIPDADNVTFDSFDGKLIAGLGEGVAYLSLDWLPRGDTEPRLIAVFAPRSDVPAARQLGEMLIAWADTWQDEYDRFTYAAPCGINIAPGAQPNPACTGDHDDDGVCC